MKNKIAFQWKNSNQETILVSNNQCQNYNELFEELNKWLPEDLKAIEIANDGIAESAIGSDGRIHVFVTNDMFKPQSCTQISVNKLWAGIEDLVGLLESKLTFNKDQYDAITKKEFFLKGNETFSDFLKNIVSIVKEQCAVPSLDEMIFMAEDAFVHLQK